MHTELISLLVPDRGFCHCHVSYEIEPRQIPELPYYKVTSIILGKDDLDVEQMLRLNGDMQREILKARQGEFASRELKMDADEIGSKPKAKAQSTEIEDGQLKFL